MRSSGEKEEQFNQLQHVFVLAVMKRKINMAVGAVAVGSLLNCCDSLRRLTTSLAVRLACATLPPSQALWFTISGYLSQSSLGVYTRGEGMAPAQS